MVAVAVYQIRQSYVDVINSDDAMPGIVALSKLLLQDFDQRYVPADDTGKVKYHQTDELGKFNRYKGVHQYFMFASFLDPRVVPILSDILTQTDFNLLKSDILELMASQAKVNKDKPTTNNQQATQVSKGPTLLVATPPNKAKTKQSRIMEKMFSGLKTHGTQMKMTILSNRYLSWNWSSTFEMQKVVHVQCIMPNLNSTIHWGGGNRIVLGIHVRPILLGSS